MPQHGPKTWMLIGISLLTVVGLLGGWYSMKPARDVSHSFEIPPISESRFLNTAAAAAYAGTEACARCHVDEHESYLQTAHSQALAEVDLSAEPPDGEFVHHASGRSYRIFRRDDQLWHQESIRRPLAEDVVVAEFPMKYAIGSGRFSRSFLVETDGFLVESPATWYSERPGWAISPGYDKYNSGFERPAEIRCMNCHVGRAETVDHSPHRLQIHSQAIDCERCHGPGAAHVAQHEGSFEPKGDYDLTIVNPRHLSRAQGEAICAQCHLHGVATVDVRGRTLADFRPGLDLHDFAIHYGLESPSEEMQVVGHIEQLRLSRCYQGSDSLTCTTCHHPHRKLEPAESASFFRARCLSCHAERDCGLDATDRRRRDAADNCVGCHMPRGPTEIPHFAFTHHRIGLHQAQPAALEDRPAAQERGVPTPLSPVSHLPAIEQDRLLGLAYLQLSDAPGHTGHAEHYREQAIEILNDVHSRGVSDPELDAALSRLYWQRDPQKSIEFAQAALAAADPSPDARATALFTLGSSRFDEQQYSLAAPFLEQAVAVRRYAPAWSMLSICRAEEGDAAGALQAARQAVEISPYTPAFHLRLAALYAQAGEAKLSRTHRERAALLTRLEGGPR